MVYETILHVVLFAYEQFLAYSIIAIPLYKNESQLENQSYAIYFKEIQWSQENFYRYYTNWNLGLQYLFLLFLLAEDFLRLTRYFPKIVHDKLSIFNSYFFFSLIFPVSGLVFFGFWGLFLYEKDLIWPPYGDLLLPFELNIMFHAIILAVVLLILVFYKRPLPKLVHSMIILFLYNGAYGLLTLETFFETGHFVYIFQDKSGLTWTVLSGVVLHGMGFTFLFIGRFLSQLIHGEVVHDKNRFDVQK